MQTRELHKYVEIKQRSIKFPVGSRRKRKIRKYFEMYEDEYTTCQKLRNSVKTVHGENLYL